MGNCRSHESQSTFTAKLILLDGQLQEFSWPIKVSFLVQQSLDSFICSSDEMELDEFLAAMGGDEVLQPGELYFELPRRWLSHRLQADDMAVLAFKASTALAGKYSRDDDDKIIYCCSCCGRRKIEPVMLFGDKERPLLEADRGGADGSRASRFVGKLSAIGEE